MTREMMHGTMLWFNAAKDSGALTSADGERLVVPGGSFLPGEKPVERCAGKEVAFTVRAGTVSDVAFVPEVSPRRARMRHTRR